MMNRKHILLAFFAVITLLFFWQVLGKLDNWGLYDWDQHMLYHAAPAKAILDYGQFPLWNAHQCGGTPLLANPQSPFLTPFFLLVLLFGAPIGLKLQAIAYFALGLGGAFLAARQLKNSHTASALAAAIFMLSSWYAARLLVGHTTFFPFALLPWAFFFYLKSPENQKWMVGAALTLALMFLAGGIYPFYASALLIGGYGTLTAIEKRKVKPIIVVAGIVAAALLLSAVKLLPVMELTSSVPAQQDTQLTGLGMIGRGLLHPVQGIEKNNALTGRDELPEGREKELATLRGEIPWQWHEYSAYIGTIALLLALLALLKFRKNWKLLMLAAFFLLLALGDHSPIPVWQLLRSLPFLGAFHGPSRFAIPLVFIIALLAAGSLTSLKLPRKKIASLLILAVVTVELLLVSYPLLSESFPLVPPSKLQTDNDKLIQVTTSSPYVSQYPNLVQNLGTLNCYERVHITTRALPQFVDGEPYKGFIGEAYIAGTNRTARITSFSPNRFVVDLSGAEINGTETLVLNHNYYPGWKANLLTDVRGLPSLRSASNGKAKSHNGLIAAEVTPDDKKVEFYFTSRNFVIGLLVTLLTLVSLLLLLLKPRLVKKLLFQEQS